ncbi:hypothetical protein RDI58_025219 [Solanum bulbocastanum]
MFFKFV